MRLWKPKYRGQDGKLHETPRWHLEFRDHIPKVRRMAAFTDKAQSRELGRRLQILVTHRVSGGQLGSEMAKWLEGLPPRLLTHLFEIGLVDSRRVAAGKRLSEHVEDFRLDLLAKGRTPKHAQLVVGRVRRVMDACGFKFWADIVASSVQKCLADMRTGKKGIGAQTSNFYLAAVKQFCHWMVYDRRATASPLAHLKGLNVRIDRRHDRRALSADELRRLLGAAKHGPERYGMAGPERALLYRLAVETGLRAGELRSLTGASFRLQDAPPTVTVAAAYSKHRREDMLRLRPATAALVAGHLTTKPPAASAFNMPRPDYVAKMIRADLADAGILYRDGLGRVADFHALRHSFITNLVGAGVHPKIVQQLARHSTITLTMDRYAHTMATEEAGALAALPDLSLPVSGGGRRSAATASDGGILEIENLPSSLALDSGGEWAEVGANVPASLDGAIENARRGGRAVECDGLLNRRGPDVTPCKTTPSDLQREYLARFQALMSQERPDVAAVARTWPHLSLTTKLPVLSMVTATKGKGPRLGEHQH